ncbi:MAG: autotransporter outer membrane beta-barrel domain-containing protein, partial [Opitutales bacterium]|nr:autotransporter outer membrane beta-barrel domain-containing protein [Opitutales bacterium]
VIGAAGYGASVDVKEAIFKIEGDKNIFSSYSGYYSVVIGAASSEETSTARGISININGSQMIGALAGAKVNAFGADNTDADANKTGWRIGLYNSETNAATVNILAAKGSTAFSNDQATMTLNADQGSDRTNYARAFALGNDYQIYIGGQGDVSRDSNDRLQSIGTELKSAGTSTGNVVNIFGAIAPAQNATLTDTSLRDAEIIRVPDTRFTVDRGWTANVYGPLEGVEAIVVKDGGVLNTYGSLKNITLEKGIINAYGESDGIGTIVLKDGTLKLVSCEDNGAVTALNNMTKDRDPEHPDTSAPILKFANPSDNAKICDVASINSTDYVKNFGNSGKLILHDGDSLCFYVNTDLPESQLGNAVLATGYIEIEESLQNAIDFSKTSKIVLVNTGTQPFQNEERKFILIRGKNMTVQELLGDDDFHDNNLTSVEGRDNLWEVKTDGAFGQWTEDQEETEVATHSEEGAELRTNIASNPLMRMVRAFNTLRSTAEDNLRLWLEETEDYSQLLIAREMALEDPVTVEDSPIAGTSNSLANTNIAAMSMLRSALNSRLTDISAGGDEAFISGIGGHVHQNELAGVGYSGDLYGITARADKLLHNKDCGYIRLGAMIGYLYGDINFRGLAIGKKQTAKQDNYIGMLYGAYESVNDKNLKTDLNLSFGFGYTNNRVSRIDEKDFGYNAKVKSNDILVSAEFIKNVYAVQGIQFGLWLKADYNRIHQKSYNESASNGGKSAQSVSKVNFDFLDTTVGINIEKEICNSSRADRSLRLYARAGWNCQPLRHHSTISAEISGKSGVVDPEFGSHNSAVFIAGLRQRLNANWEIIGEWNGSFNKKHSNNVVTVGAGYSF